MKGRIMALSALEIDKLHSNIVSYVTPFFQKKAAGLDIKDATSISLPLMASKRLAIGVDNDTRKLFIGLQETEANIFSNFKIKEIVFLRHIMTETGPKDYVIFSFYDILDGQGEVSNGETKSFPFIFWYHVGSNILDALKFNDEELTIDLISMEVSPNGEAIYPEEDIILNRGPLLYKGNWEGIKGATLNPSKGNEDTSPS